MVSNLENKYLARYDINQFAKQIIRDGMDARVGGNGTLGRPSPEQRIEGEINGLHADKRILRYYMPHEDESRQARALETIAFKERHIQELEQQLALMKTMPPRQRPSRAKVY